MTHPYENLGENFFWSSAVAKKNMFDIDRLWDPKYLISRRMKVATYGSCFAQNLGRALDAKGFDWLITEAGPEGVDRELLKAYQYGIFTSRTGNIYTASLLNQWVSWALGQAPVPTEIWEKDGRFYDPFRPNIEPGGFASKEELKASRRDTIASFKESLTSSDVFVFTLGLTESWFNASEAYEYPMCPGTVAGEFDPSRHEFRNQQFDFIRKHLSEAIDKISQVNGSLKILLTVSPVPLTATMSGNHVLLASMESKSTLRSIAGFMRSKYSFVDYFPSYEIFNAPPFKGSLFEANQRSVSRSGVDHAMSIFFESQQEKFGSLIEAESAETKAKAGKAGLANDKRRKKKLRKRKFLKKRTGGGKSADAVAGRKSPHADDVVCEEELLNVFASRGS